MATASPPTPSPTPQPVASTPHPVSSAPRSAESADSYYINLLPGERQLHKATFTPKMLTPHLLSEVVLTEERLLVRHPTTIFMFFPTGYQLSVAELGKIDQLNHGTILRSNRLMWGAAAGVFGLLGLVTGGLLAGGGGVGVLFSLLLLAVAVGLILTARVTAILAETGGGKLAVVGQGRERASLEDTAYRISAAMREIRGGH